MYKVMIVDDEEIFRDYLRTQIEWETYGFKLCGEAVDGVEALKLAKQEKPDIAIVDINMPNMDGLTLSRALKEENEDISIILITGYDQFEYARKAIKIGVEDYFIKPFLESELLATLNRTKAKLIKKRKQKEEQKNHIREKRERVLNILLEGGNYLIDEEINKEMERLDIQFKEKIFVVTTIVINNLFQRCKDVNAIAEDKYTVINITNNMFNSMSQNKCCQTAFLGPENRIISITGFKDVNEVEKVGPEIYKNIARFLMNNFDIDVTVGFGTVVDQFTNIKTSYLNSLYAIRNKNSDDASRVILYSDIKQELKDMRFYPSVVNERLTMFLRLNDYYQIKQELENVYAYCIDNKLNMDYNYAIFMGLKAVCMSYITEKKEKMETVLGVDFSPVPIINNKITIEEERTIINEMFRRTVTFFTNSKVTRIRKVAEMVKEYIDLHYDDSELSLEKIANHFFLNYDYARRSFKRVLNTTLTDYIMSVRMKKAKELMGTGNIKLSSVCYEVGINDASYFSKCFKKYYGLTPREYETMIHGNTGDLHEDE